MCPVCPLAEIGSRWELAQLECAWLIDLPNIPLCETYHSRDFGGEARPSPQFPLNISRVGAVGGVWRLVTPKGKSQASQACSGSISEKPAACRVHLFHLWGEQHPFVPGPAVLAQPHGTDLFPGSGGQVGGSASVLTLPGGKVCLLSFLVGGG